VCILHADHAFAERCGRGSLMLRRLGIGLASISILGVGVGTATTATNPGSHPIRPFTARIRVARVDPVLATASFSFVATGSLATSFTCDLNGTLTPSGTLTRAPSTCVSPRHYRNLPVGVYTFSVYGVGGGGSNSTTASRSFTITDGCPPGQTIASLDGHLDTDADSDGTSGGLTDGDSCL
jgi:hypothetical protein